jgi:ribonuclease P protein component
MGTVFHAPHLSLRVTPAGMAPARVSVVVSKKSAKRAVDRHLIKRRVYDSVSELGEMSGALYVFFAKTGAHTIPYRELQEEVRTLLSGAKAAIEKLPRLV